MLPFITGQRPLFVVVASFVEGPMRCPKCQTELPDTAKFCLECGANVRVASFGFELPPGPRSEQLISQPERKHVTALFCDLAGYTAITEKLDPEIVKEITSRIFGEVKLVIAKYEGFIERVIGDGVLAFFGVPRAHEDDPIRAIQAATEIHDLVTSMSPQYQDKLGAPLAMHSGINTGLVVTADVDPEKGAHGVAGDAVNIASRLSDLADPGEILVGHDTHIRAEGVFAFEDLGFRKVKGKAELVRIFRVLGTKTARRVLRFDRHVSSQMLGRDGELERLEFLVTKAVNGEGSVVNIVGEAGIGKSRLVAELKNREVMKRATVLEGRAISVGTNLSFHPVTGILKEWAGIGDGDSEAAAFGRLEKAIRAVHPEEAHEILPFVATLMRMKLVGRYAERIKGIEGEPLEKLIVRAVRELVVTAAKLQPIVIIMEDLHWADVSSLELLDALYRLTENHRIAFINVFRPGYIEINGGKLTKIGRWLPISYVGMEIQPLDMTDSSALIDNMLRKKGLPHAVKQKIVERAGGNPLFIEEVVCSLIDEGAVVKREGRFDVTEKIDGVVIPPTIEDVLRARIDRLEEQTRELVKIASVIGRSFFDRVIKEVAGSIENVGDRLAYLQEVQLIRSRERMEELEYLFKHVLVQEAAYESILHQQRRQLHLKVAESVERIFRERLHEVYGMLAYHYGRAKCLEKAEECLIKAGEEALKSAAPNEALNYYQEALQIYLRLRGADADPEKVAMLEKNIALALFNRGHYAEAVEHFDKALNYYWGTLPKNALSTAFKFTSSFTKFILALHFPIFWFRKNPSQKDAETADLFHKKAQALVIINPKRFFVESFFFYDTIVRFNLTEFRFGFGIFVGSSALFSFTGLSLSLGRKILDYAKPRLDSDNPKQCIIYDLLDTQHLFLKGHWNEITEYKEDLVNKILRIGDMWDAAQHYYWHGLPKIFQGHFDAARLMVSKLSNIAEAYDNDIYYLLKYLQSIYLLTECGGNDEATDVFNAGLDLVHKKGWGLSIFNMYSLKASMHLSMKELEKARNSLDQANQIRPEVKVVPIQLAAFYRSEFDYYLRRLEDALRDGRREDLSEHRRNAIKSGKLLIRTCQKAALYRTESYRLMGVYQWLTQDRKNAFKWWNRAVREGERLGARPQLARTYAEMAIRPCLVKGSLSEPDVRRSQEYLEKAITMFRDMGLHHDLEGLNSVIHRRGLELSEV